MSGRINFSDDSKTIRRHLQTTIQAANSNNRQEPVQTVQKNIPFDKK